MENSPPGIQTMPSGAGPCDRGLSCALDANAGLFGLLSEDGRCRGKDQCDPVGRKKSGIHNWAQMAVRNRRRARSELAFDILDAVADVMEPLLRLFAAGLHALANLFGSLHG